MRSNSTRARTPLVAWLLAVAVAILVTAWHATRDDWVHSNVFELLPASDYDPLTETATRLIDNELGTQLLFFVGHSDTDVAKAAADRLARGLRQIDLIGSVDATIDDTDLASLARFYYPFRSRLLTREQIARIDSEPSAMEAEAAARFFSPFSLGVSLETDPFGLFQGSLAAMQPANSNISVRDGRAWAHREGRDYVFVRAQLVSATLSIGEQESLAARINAELEQLTRQNAGIDTLKTGFAFYAEQSTRSAKNEISTIGVGSLAGLLLLVIATFRSLRPLSLIAFSILSGIAVALAVTLSVFGFVHLFTLVFGASLIGVSVDYGFHYIADDAFGGADWTPQRGLRNIFPGITLGLATSVFAYLALTVAPFPGLQQLAVFSSAGLIGAYLTLLCTCRLWRRRFAVQRNSPLLAFARRYLAAWKWSGRRGLWLIPAALALVTALAWRQVAIDDDIRVLQSQPADLVAQESAIREMLGFAQGGTFLLVNAPDEEALLQREETIREVLDALIENGRLGAYQATSSWVPSRAHQDRSLDAWRELMRTRLASLLATLGVDASVATTLEPGLTTEAPALTVADWHDHPGSEPFRRLWLASQGPEPASLVLLFGVRDVEAVAAAIADIDDARLINKARQLSLLFGEYRERVAQLLLAAYAIILAGLAVRYGLLRAALVTTPPVVAGVVALVAISAAGGTLNLFNFLALILVLGIGIDFTLFLVEARHDLEATLFAITLSAITTMLSFGLLALSSTYAVHSFGLTVLVGIACAYLLSPLAIRARVGDTGAG